MGVTTALNVFLRSEGFRRKLIKRYERFEILSEAGLRSAVDDALRAKIRAIGTPAVGYRVSCEPRLPISRVVPDILVWKREDPRIWIELKDTKYFDQNKAEMDWQKLRVHKDQYPTVRAWYLIYVARYSEPQFQIKRSRETLRFWPIAIALDKYISGFADWDKKYGPRAHYEGPIRRPDTPKTPVKPISS